MKKYKIQIGKTKMILQLDKATQKDIKRFSEMEEKKYKKSAMEMLIEKDEEIKTYE